MCSPEKASWGGVGIAVEGRVLRPQQEREDGCSAGAQGVAHNHQAVMHGAFTL